MELSSCLPPTSSPASPAAATANLSLPDLADFFAQPDFARALHNFLIATKADPGSLTAGKDLSSSSRQIGSSSRKLAPTSATLNIAPTSPSLTVADIGPPPAPLSQPENLLFGFLLVASSVEQFINWAWVRPKRIERLFRKQGMKGTTYKPLLADMKEVDELYKKAFAKPIDFADDIVPCLMPNILDTFRPCLDTNKLNFY
ncbi:cytochrome P450 [Striga asiatica]|uniref:Cytochrome P450 n=1 Tax=Striga asiatica TaxID=4170 RepID=A0A5A7RG72_STRAF|nr:cytochrome P450 [Striga asiatica]